MGVTLGLNELAETYTNILSRLRSYDGVVIAEVKAEDVDMVKPPMVPVILGSGKPIWCKKYPAQFTLEIYAGKKPYINDLGLGEHLISEQYGFDDYVAGNIDDLRGQVGLRIQEIMQFRDQVILKAPMLGFEEREAMTREKLEDRLKPAQQYELVRSRKF